MSEILVRAHRRLEDDGVSGLRIWVMERSFPSVIEAVAAVIRDQASGWYPCHEVIQDGVTILREGESGKAWARQH